MNEIFLPLLGGIVALYIGAELLIWGGASFSLRLGLSALVIGLTIVGFGTGFPELVVSANASLAGKGDIALGNVIGSNISNIGLILGITALFYPFKVERKGLHKAALFLLGLCLILWALVVFGTIGRFIGLLFFFGLLGYTFLTVYYGAREAEKTGQIVKDVIPSRIKNVWLDVLLIVCGLTFLLAGGKLFLNGAISLARLWGISDAVLGLTVVAIGTSLPELATSFVAALRKHRDIALGNIIGSCIFNILGIVGFAAILRPISTVDLGAFDMAIMTGFCAFLLWLMRKEEFIISRVHGFGMVTVYALFLWLIVTFQ